jgi:hypothetical protein
MEVMRGDTAEHNCIAYLKGVINKLRETIIE